MVEIHILHIFFLFFHSYIKWNIVYIHPYAPTPEHYNKIPFWFDWNHKRKSNLQSKYPYNHFKTVEVIQVWNNHQSFVVDESRVEVKTIEKVSSHPDRRSKISPHSATLNWSSRNMRWFTLVSVSFNFSNRVETVSWQNSQLSSWTFKPIYAMFWQRLTLWQNSPGWIVATSEKKRGA